MNLITNRKDAKDAKGFKKRLCLCALRVFAVQFLRNSCIVILFLRSWQLLLLQRYLAGLFVGRVSRGQLQHLPGLFRLLVFQVKQPNGKVSGR